MKLSLGPRIGSKAVFIALLFLVGRSANPQDVGTELKFKVAQNLATRRFAVTVDPIKDVMIVSDRLAGSEFDYAYALSNILETIDLLAQKRPISTQNPLPFSVIYRANPQVFSVEGEQIVRYIYAIPLTTPLLESYQGSQSPSEKTKIVKKLLANGELFGWGTWNGARPFSSMVLENPSGAADAMSSVDDATLKALATKLQAMSDPSNEAEVAKILEAYIQPVNSRGSKLWAAWATTYTGADMSN